MRKSFTALLAAMLLVVAACGEAAPSPASTPTATPGPTSTAAVTAAPPSSPSAAPPSLTPSPTPLPSAATPGPITSPGAVMAASLPVQANAASIGVALAPAPGGRLFVAVPAEKGTVLALLDARGKVRRGWPVLPKGASGCELDADLADGSVRAVCVAGKTVRAYSLDAAGQPMAGWPVTLPAGDVAAMRLVDGNLYLLIGETFLAVLPDGTIRTGPTVQTTSAWSSIGPDGTLYTQVGDNTGTDVVATTLDGVRDGWPVRVSGWVSAPSFGPDGRIYVTADTPDDSGGDLLIDRSSQVIVYTMDGRISDGWPVRTPIDTWRVCPEGACAPNPPVVASDGSAYIVAANGGTVAYRIGPMGDLDAGWPYESAATLVAGVTSNCACLCQGTCVCPAFHSYPLAGPDDTLYLAQSVQGGGGDRIVAVEANGEVMAGWPVRLTEKGAWFQTFAVGDGGAVFGFAIEPAGSRPNVCGEKSPVYSGTIVALDGHGDAIYTTTIIVP